MENDSNKEDCKSEAIFTKGDFGPAENFTGKVWNTSLVANNRICHTVVENVYFEPGAGSN